MATRVRLEWFFWELQRASWQRRWRRRPRGSRGVSDVALGYHNSRVTSGASEDRPTSTPPWSATTSSRASASSSPTTSSAPRPRPLDTAESCWQTYRSLDPNFDMNSSYGFQTAWISQGCLNLTTKSIFEALIPNSALSDEAWCIRPCPRPNDADTSSCLFSVGPGNNSNNGSSGIGLILGILIGVGVGFALLVGGTWFAYRKHQASKRKKGKDRNGSLDMGGSGLGSISDESTNFLHLTFDEIKEATRNFERHHHWERLGMVIGEGQESFGCYRRWHAGVGATGGSQEVRVDRVLFSQPELQCQPTMDQVVKMLETGISVPSIPERPIPLVAQIDDIERSISSNGSGQFFVSGYQMLTYESSHHSGRKDEGLSSSN
ncbi:hypothetical protein F3Y22_tig00111096pilonHSYRG00065 [Hibiscus syriacus]|uniref:SPARK domain-containing protein n=1 Tax=Hibiscus syriacus TaxID=106335 RepID=A0A6A2Z358_HIBSY|nr:hypothetical protein F3Y22_tig00111096pilonHSYRG00065 [Hibiscus syriacus]